MRVHGTNALEKRSSRTRCYGHGGRTVKYRYGFNGVRKGLAWRNETVEATIRDIGDTAPPQGQEDGLLMNVVHNLMPLFTNGRGVQFLLDCFDFCQETITGQATIQVADGGILDVTWDVPRRQVAVRIIWRALIIIEGKR